MNQQSPKDAELKQAPASAASATIIARKGWTQKPVVAARPANQAKPGSFVRRVDA